MIRIIIYGLGERGQEFIQDIQEVLQNIQIVAVTDTFWEQVKQEIKLDVPYIEPYRIRDCIFDYIVITPAKCFREIKNQLCSWGIEENKIKTPIEITKKLNNTYCILCKNHIGVWKYTGLDYDIFRYKKIVGASKRRGRCPICGSSDRERYVYYIINMYTELLKGEHSVLHFAPEKMLSEKVREKCKNMYVSADIEQDRADVIADITNLQFKDGQFEYIICNHVLEHIKEENKAFSEMRRCLKKEGILILTVPLCWEQKTYENINIVTKDERIKYYGQADHVRLYGNDIIERIEKFGFDVTAYIVNDIFDEENIRKFGFINKDVVLLCQK